MSRTLPICAILLPLLWSCSSGGSSSSPQSDVRINADHHVFGFTALPSFGTFPVTLNEVSTLRATLRLVSDSSYSIFDAAGTLANGTYLLQNDARLSILVPTSGATQVYRGAYGLSSNTGHFFFTDRVGTGVGLYFGTLRIDGTADVANLAANWHMFSLAAILSDPAALPGPDGVGRSFAGSVTLAADGSFTGDGVESTNPAAVLPVSGPAAALAPFPGHEFELAVTFGQGSAAVTRAVRGGGTDSAIFCVDGEEAQGSAGLLAMMRFRDAGAVDLAQLEGTYVFGYWTLFVDPSRMGSDAAIGTLQLTQNGDFRIDATNNTGDNFSYRGTYVATDDGTLTFTVDGTNETWQGAFDNDYATVMVADTYKETRTGNAAGIVELSLGIGLRENQP